QDGENSISNIIGSAIDIPIDIKLYIDARATIFTRGIDEANSFYSGDTIFYELGYSCLNDIGCSPPIGRINRDDWGINIGILAQRKTIKGDQAEYNQKEREYRGEDRPSNGNIRE